MAAPGDSKDNDYHYQKFGKYPVKLIDNQGVAHEMPASRAAQSHLVVAMLWPKDDEESEEEEHEVPEIPTPNVDTETMRVIHTFMRQFSVEPFQKLPRPITTDKLPVSSSFTDMLDSLSHDLLIKLLNASNYLDIPPLTDLTAAYIAMKLKNDEAFRNFLAERVQGASKSNV